MENSMGVVCDEIREENSVGLQKSTAKRKIFIKRHHFRSGHSLPLQGRSSEAPTKQGTSTKPVFHLVFKCLTPSLLAVVAVKYQAISEDPFKKFAPHIWTFLITILIYSVMLLKMKQSRNLSNRYLKVFHRVALAAGVVSCLSLVSLILPHFDGLIVLYASWALFVIISAFPVIQCICNGLFTGITTVLNRLVSLARNLFSGSIFNQQPPPQGARSPV